MIWCVDVEQSAHRVVLTVVEPGAAPRVVATWSAGGGPQGSPAVSVSPSGDHVAVVAAGRLRVVDARDGSATSATDVEVGADPLVRPIIAWRTGDDPVVITDFARPRSVPLAAGWTVEVDGDVTVDGGFSGGDLWGQTSLAFDADESAEERRAAYAELLQETAAAARRPVPFRLALRRGGTEVVVHDELRAPADGTTTLHWPPVVTDHGVLLRRSRTTIDTSTDRVRTSTEAQRPWFVSLSGAVRELPPRLGVGPLAALPGGAWLLPGVDALWRDDYDEPLHRLGEDGRLEPLRFGRAPIMPSRLVRLVDPAKAATEGARRDDGEALWMFEAAAVDTVTDELRLLLTDAQLAAPSPEPLRWHAVAVPLNGSAELRILGSGASPDATTTAIAV